MEEFELNIITALYLCTIITKILKTDAPTLNCDDRKQANKLVYTLNKMNLKLRDGQTLLHLAVNGVTPVDDFHTSDVCRFPCVETVKLLLECGASVSALDCSRNSPLHTLTATVRKSNELIVILHFPTNRMISKIFPIQNRHSCHSFLPNSCNRSECLTRTSTLIISTKSHVCSLWPAFIWTPSISKVSPPHKYVHHVSVRIHSISGQLLVNAMLREPLINSETMILTFRFSILSCVTTFLAVSHQTTHTARRQIPTAHTALIQAVLRRYEFNETSLKCLASRCIAQHKIAYKNVVPKQLETYIQLHSAEKI